VLQLLITPKVAPSSPILVILMMVVVSSPETTVFTTATRRNIQEDGIIHSHYRENLKSYMGIHCLTGSQSASQEGLYSLEYVDD
jgi:hypothetical protein